MNVNPSRSAFARAQKHCDQTVFEAAVAHIELFFRDRQNVGIMDEADWDELCWQLGLKGRDAAGNFFPNRSLCDAIGEDPAR